MDEAALRRLVRRQVAAGIHFLVPCGTTGENPTLSSIERRRVVEIVVEEAAGRVPVLASASGYDTREVAALARETAAAGANGLLSVTPYYNKPTPDGLYAHYRAVADATALPVIVEDDVLVGGNCGIDEGTIVKRRAVLGSGTILTGSTRIFDLVRGEIIRREGDQPIIVPEGAVVAPGSRAVTQEPGRCWGLSLATPVIVKYRDEKTAARVELEQWIR